MKIALLMTGFLRSFDITYPSIKGSIMDNHDVDVYACTWDRDEAGNEVDRKRLIDKLVDRLGGIKFMNHEYYKENRFAPIELIPNGPHLKEPKAEYWIERLRDQWYIVKEGFSLIDDPAKYDAIMRVRFDLQIFGLDVRTDRDIVVPPSIVGNPSMIVSDHLAYGTPAAMTKYCNFFDHIESLYRNHGVDISHAERMLRYYLVEHEPVLNVGIENINYRVVR